MYTLIVCLFIACLIPYLSKIPLAMAMKKQPGGYDNSTPRAQQAELKGFGSRALAAHQNSFESLLIFSTAILTALATQHTCQTIQICAIVYLISRCMYHLLYLLNWATMRTTIWSIGLVMSLSILYLCIP